MAVYIYEFYDNNLDSLDKVKDKELNDFSKEDLIRHLKDDFTFRQYIVSSLNFRDRPSNNLIENGSLTKTSNYVFHLFDDDHDNKIVYDVCLTVNVEMSLT